MKRWILVTSGKGGVGKSLVARLLAEAKREAEPATWLLDGDGEVGQLVQYLGLRDENGRLVRGQAGDRGVGSFALHAWRDDAGMREVLEGLIAPLRAAPADVLVDLPAASLGFWLRSSGMRASLRGRRGWDFGRPGSFRSHRSRPRASRSPTRSNLGRATTSSRSGRNSGATTAIIDAGSAPNCAKSSWSVVGAKWLSRACAAGSS